MDTHILARLKHQKERYEALKKEQKVTVITPDNQAFAEYIFHSESLAGNPLTLSQVRKIVGEKKSVRGVGVTDVIDAYAHELALHTVLSHVETQPKAKITAKFIHTLYKLLNPMGEQGGKGKILYRTSDFTKTSPIRKLPSSQDVPRLLQSLTRWINSAHVRMHVLEVATRTHHRLLWIYPYPSQNGKLARLILQLVLLREGYPLTPILAQDGKHYKRCLRMADKGVYTPLIQLICRSVERSLQIALRSSSTPVVGMHEIQLPLSRIAQRFPYSKKYLNLLVRMGRLEAYKKGRVWVTSSEAVKRYMEGRKRMRKATV